MPSIDPTFTALPAADLADVALSRAADLGAEHADFRLERVRRASFRLRDARPDGAHDGEELGFGVRVIAGGSWGFAAGVDLTADEVARVVGRAVAVARLSAPMNSERVELADEPVYPDAVWCSEYDVDPFDVPDADKLGLLAEWSERLLAADGVDHVDATLLLCRENKFYADLAGTRTVQQRVRLHPELTATAIDAAGGSFTTMRTCGPAVARGWEYLGAGNGVWDWDDELARLPEWLAEKAKAPSVDAGSYDLVIDPSNLWLTIHESVGHATELDRAFGYEANYAGTSFATFDKLGTFRYGSPLMNVTGDRTTPGALASVGYDDEGVRAQRWDIVREGVLAGYQLDRRIARLSGLGRSNGCAFADSPGHIPIQRMANVSLAPGTDDTGTEDLISGVSRGIYVVGDNSWSIDMQRYNFQFTAQRFYAIRDGRLAGQLRDVAYQSNTPEFWGSLAGLGGPATYLVSGSFNCGKGQPGQGAAVSHGCPSTLFTGVNILNTAREAGR
ncbi:MAG TPA: TldD/PmbA family protein [Pseudonocardiaceae bacterium]